MARYYAYATTFHFEGVPRYLQTAVEDEFMRHYGDIVEIFNKHIGKVNSQWNLLGEPAAFRDRAKTINPKYTKFVNDSIQPYIDAFNKRLSSPCKYRMGEDSRIEGYIEHLQGSKIWITLEAV